MEIWDVVGERGISNERLEELVLQWLNGNPSPKDADNLGWLLKYSHPGVHKKVRENLRKIAPYHDE